MECDPDKVATIASWPWPTNVSKVQMFCGLASYNKAFVQDFTRVARPLHNLLRKSVSFVCNDDCEAAFLELKK